MNWFERYGIPGLYFVGLMAGWAYAFCDNLDTLLRLIPALIAISLPTGYIISIMGQYVYLNWRRCFWGCPRLRRWLGFHGAALDLENVVPKNQERDEAIIEARTLLLTASKNGYLDVSTHIYIRNWIARRMDVCAINISLIIATLIAPFLAGIIAFVICRLQQGSPSVTSVIVLFIISISSVVMLAMVLSIRVLRRQVIEVIAGIYRTNNNGIDTWSRPW